MLEVLELQSRNSMSLGQDSLAELAVCTLCSGDVTQIASVSQEIAARGNRSRGTQAVRSEMPPVASCFPHPKNLNKISTGSNLVPLMGQTLLV